MTEDSQHVRRRSILGAMALGSVSLTGLATASAAPTERYVVTASGRHVRRRLEDAGARVDHEVADGEFYVVGFDGDREALASVPGVQDVAHDERASSEASIPERRATGADASSVGEETIPEAPPVPAFDLSTEDSLLEEQWDKQRLRAREAHDVATGAGTTIAVIDSGINHAHPDLTPNVDVDAGRAFEDGEVRRGTGPVDIFDAQELTRETHRHVADDVFGHGTDVAGVAGAAWRDGRGTVGVAPDARLVSLRALQMGTFELPDGTPVYDLYWTLTDVVLAVEYAVEIGADVITLSLASGPFSPQDRGNGLFPVFQRLFQYAVREGSVVVVSADNDETDYQRGGHWTVPASEPASITVSATGPTDERAFYSNYGTNLVDVAAPGGGYETRSKTGCNPHGEVCVYDETGQLECEPCEPPSVPYPSNLVLTPTPNIPFAQADYWYVYGTSFAAPQVAGLAALVRELEPELSPKQVEQAIYHGAVGTRGRGDPDLGAGRIDLVNTLERVR
ncbi:S8 family peptidase [Natronobiforma cellulositropha]|uniref:S8 family peptidase n=1 Tax=Natronobiforma cellulositropha TaxID=1679076 RepID=UPI00294FFDC6|nr:S8 family serine peptidase [Natronobiforma cellulositropha]